jgi:L-asparagine transporter-like permease
MLIFLNYEGFELIANASRDVADPKRSLPIAYRSITGRRIHLVRKSAEGGVDTATS